MSDRAMADIKSPSQLGLRRIPMVGTLGPGKLLRGGVREFADLRAILEIFVHKFADLRPNFG